MSLAEMKTPGVYIVEKNAFPNSVVQVATGIPVFIGYTETAARGDQNLQNMPHAHFINGGTTMGYLALVRIRLSRLIRTLVRLDSSQAPGTLCIRVCGFFFNNGGGPCWIVSVGGYRDDAVSAAALIDLALKALEGEREPTIMLAPDAVLLEHDEWAKVANAYLDHCGKLMSRVVILDVPGGDVERNGDRKTDVISDSETGMRFKKSSVSQHPMAWRIIHGLIPLSFH